jgi:hypothetical protein
MWSSEIDHFGDERRPRFGRAMFEQFAKDNPGGIASLSAITSVRLRQTGIPSF